MSRGRVLITGFEPFDDDINASAALVESLRSELPTSLRSLASRIDLALLPVDTERIGARVEDLLRGRPAVWLLTGQDRSRGRICVETRAANERSFAGPDNAGKIVRGDPVVPGAPPELPVTVGPVAELVTMLRARRVDAEASDDAGRFLCNQALFLALLGARAVAGGARDDGARTAPPRIGFVHVPLLPEQARRVGNDAMSMPLIETRRALSLLVQAVAAAIDRG